MSRGYSVEGASDSLLGERSDWQGVALGKGPKPSGQGLTLNVGVCFSQSWLIGLWAQGKAGLVLPC